jgi:hypothetical protein
MNDARKPDRIESIERILHEALAETVELLTRDVQQDAENIRALARNSQILHDSIKGLQTIAEAHQQRIDRLEGQ